MNRKVIDCIDRYHMLSPHDHVVVGVSGGADSLALLYFLVHELPDYQLRITACHINHLLRGEESMRDQEARGRIMRAVGCSAAGRAD